MVIKCTKDNPLRLHLHLPLGDQAFYLHEDSFVEQRDEDFVDGQVWVKHACPHCGFRWWQEETSFLLGAYLSIDRSWREEEDDAKEDAMLSLWERMDEGEKERVKAVMSKRKKT